MHVLILNFLMLKNCDLFQEIEKDQTLGLGEEEGRKSMARHSCPESCWQPSNSARDLVDWEFAIDCKWIGMNTSRVLCIWNHHSERIKRNKGPIHLVQANLYIFCFFPGTFQLCFSVLTIKLHKTMESLSQPCLTGKRGMRIFQKEYSSLHQEGWRKVEKS